jgi:hypothetical protein
MTTAHDLAALQAHTSGRSLSLPATARDLRRDLRAALVRASNARKITTSTADIEARVRLLDEARLRESFGKLFKDLHDRGAHHGAFCIFGGDKNQSRDPALRHFKRDDGAWFDFSITVREADGRLELLAYDFELRLAPGMGAPFIRFDLNLPDHRNERRELRCHLHPGSDDLLLPAPMMSPSEVLSLFIHEVRLPVDRKVRTLTAFELTWLGDSLATASR